MSAPSLAKVKEGDPLAIPAPTWNELMDGALERRQRLVREAREVREKIQAGTVWVENRTNTGLSQYAVVALGAPAIKPVDNLNEFKRLPAFRGELPSGSHNPTRFAILAEPLAAGAVGTAVVDGTTIARVEIASEGDEAAEMRGGFTDRLFSTGSGIATILWKEPPAEREPANVAWCIVRIGAGGGGGSRTFRIVSIEATSFTCRFWTDPPTAPTVTVMAFMRNDPPGTPFTLAVAHPVYAVGQDIRAERRPDFDANWWAIDTFSPFGCTAQTQ